MSAHMLLVILDDLKVLPDLLDRWREIGVSGTTILHSLGGYKASSWLERVGLSMLGRGFEADELNQRTLMSVICDDDLLERAIAEAEQIVGGFDRPHSGALFVLPITRTLGLKKRHDRTPEELIATAPDMGEMSELDRMRCIPVSEVLAIHDFPPAIVERDDSLAVVATKMLDHPSTQVACVVNEEGRLCGIIRLEAIVNDLFVRLMPEEFLHELSELKEALEFADHLKHRTAADAMEEPVIIHPEDTIRTVFHRMHDLKLPGLPVVDDSHHVIGYVNLLEMLALVAKDHHLRCVGETQE